MKKLLLLSLFLFFKNFCAEVEVDNEISAADLWAFKACNISLESLDKNDQHALLSYLTSQWQAIKTAKSAVNKEDKSSEKKEYDEHRSAAGAAYRDYFNIQKLIEHIMFHCVGGNNLEIIYKYMIYVAKNAKTNE